MIFDKVESISPLCFENKAQANYAGIQSIKRCQEMPKNWQKSDKKVGIVLV